MRKEIMQALQQEYEQQRLKNSQELPSVSEALIICLNANQGELP